MEDLTKRRSSYDVKIVAVIAVFKYALNNERKSLLSLPLSVPGCYLFNVYISMVFCKVVIFLYEEELR